MKNSYNLSIENELHHSIGIDDVWSIINKAYNGSYDKDLTWDIEFLTGLDSGKRRIETMSGGIWDAVCENPKAMSLWLLSTESQPYPYAD
jgi:hypothetical protein